MKIELSYQTQELPPPYAFAASFELDTSGTSVGVSFQMEYLGREELSEEEVIAQGFTTNDDLKWEGELDTAWVPVLTDFISIEYGKEPTETSYLHVVIDGTEKGYPVVDQEVIVQELIQAVFESAKKETPLKIEVVGQDETTQTFLWSFSKRQFSIGNQLHDWSDGKQLMNLLYTLEFDHEETHPTPQPGSIQYQDTGEWLKIAEKKVMNQITHAIRQLKKT